jgi:solute carrier family 8 (sodium/calcium exchanger)
VVAYFDSERQMSCLQSWAAPAGLLAQPLSAQVAVYIITLAALFLGNAIASDYFMASVEQIVSKERTVISSDGQSRISRRIWNPTVANLTLLALGSSAPEILLSLTESASRLGKKPGHLGPATIVGTAAYNLLAITAVCTYVLPKGRVRAVRKAAVFWLTAVCSILAYVWMFVCLRLWTPGVITLVEALLTLAMMPLFVYSAYAMDCGLHVPSLLKLFGHRHEADSAKRARHGTRKNDHHPKVSKEERENGAVSQDSTPLSLAERGELSSMMNGGGRSASHSASECATDQEATPLKNVGGGASSDGTATPRKEDVYRELMAVQRPLPGTSSHDLAERIANSFREWDWPESEPDVWSNAIWYKINARHKLSGRWHKRGGAHRTPSGNFDEESVPAPTQAPHVYRRQQVSQQATKDRERFCDIHFQGKETTVLENAGSVEIVIQREGDLSQAVMVDCKSKEGSAKARQDYNPVDGTLTFLPGEEWHTIVAQLIEDEEPDPDHSFTIHLTNPRLAPNVNQSSHQNVRVRTVDPQKFTVVILDDDEPGILGFDTRLFDVLESAREARISVVRHGGSAGDVYVDYYTRDRTAVAGRDYQATSGRLHFESGERSKEIVVPIIDDDLPNPDQVFRVYLCNPHKATLGRQYMATVKIRDDDGLNALTQEVQALISKRKSLMHTAVPGPLDSSSAWATQLRESFDVGGSYDDEGNRVHPGVQEYLLHLLTLWWKVLMALAPPPTTLGGWPLFVASLCVIGVITALVGELAKLLGCAIGLKDSVTAISIVAIGTSLPDTLASCYAVLDSPAADAAIGNIMGSNAVNVFLGLGLTWVLGASYYMAHPHLTSGYYCVPTVGLSETVITFIPIASVGTAVMAIRRSRVGGELGGTGSGKHATTVLFLLLWLAFVSLSAALTYWPSQMTAKLKPPSELDQFGCPCSKGFANC